MQNVHSFYAIQDRGGWGQAKRAMINKLDDLVEQSLIKDGNERNLMPETINYKGGDLGWYVNLTIYGERIIHKPVGILSHIGFNSIVPLRRGNCIVDTDSWFTLARMDDATPLNSKSESPVSSLNHSSIYQGPVFIQSSDGKLDAFFPRLNEFDDIDPGVLLPIPKRYTRSAWRKIQFSN
jgi:hypothetical protein